MILAHGRKRKDAEHVGEVPDTREEEEEEGDALGGFAAVVQQDLREAAAEVEGGAEVAEDLAEDVVFEVRGRRVFGEVVLLSACRQPPAEDAGEADEQDGEGVEDDGAGCAWGCEVRQGGGDGVRFRYVVEWRCRREMCAGDGGDVPAEMCAEASASIPVITVVCRVIFVRLFGLAVLLQ